MLTSIRCRAAAAVLAVLAAACGGGVSVDPLGDTPAENVLSSCEPAGDQKTTRVVEASGEMPPTATMEEAVAGIPDAEARIERLQEEGRSREQALHQTYGQVVGDQLLPDASQLPGFVTGAYARPDTDEPFQLSFSEQFPEEFDPDAYDLASFGLQVTTGAAGIDPDTIGAASDAALEVGMRPISGSGDETAGTTRTTVFDATPEQVAAWEEAVDDPSRACLVRAARTVPCDDAVISEAEHRAERQDEVLPNEQTDDEPTASRAEEVRRSYLGLSLQAAEDKAADEDRALRVTARDGVPFGSTHDLRPGRLSLTICDGVVVDTRMDLELLSE